MSVIPRLVAMLAAIAAVVALSACGDDDSPSSASASDAPAQEETAARDAFPVTVEHKFGTTTIDAEPKRVVSVGYTDSDAILALGVVPVGVREFIGGYDWRNRPWAQEALGGATPELVSAEELDFEAIAAQRPDLIVGINSGMTEDDYDRLAKIAPTIAQSGDYVDFGMPWSEQTALIGKALGRSEQAEQLVSDVEAQFAAVREEHPEFGGQTAVLAYGGPDGYGAYTTQDTRTRFLSDLGFDTPEKIDELADGSFFTDISEERLDILDTDVVVMYVTGPQEGVQENPAFSRLDATKEDRVIYVDITDQFAGAMGYASALSLPYLLERSVDMFAAAADDDPATKVTQPE